MDKAHLARSSVEQGNRGGHCRRFYMVDRPLLESFRSALVTGFVDWPYVVASPLAALSSRPDAARPVLTTPAAEQLAPFWMDLG
jgi:hypothetical protein